MKRTLLFCTVMLGIGSAFSLTAAAENAADTPPARTSAAIPWSQIGAQAGANYKGDGLDIIPTAEGARLRCVFQQLEGAATREGLWLTSTATNGVNHRFRVVATAIGRDVESGGAERQSAESAFRAPRLPDAGTVAIDGQIVRFTRPGLVEEYSVSMDGVRQDFLVPERPAGASELWVQLAVSGARVESARFGARLVLENSGRKIAYSRLRVTDATGKEMAARMEVIDAVRSVDSFVREPNAFAEMHADKAICATALAVLVNDAEAVYPVRIDPTFSDANWISMGGANGRVNAAAVDGSGNLYIGGRFTVVGDVLATNIAKWDGSSWSALGSGLGKLGFVLPEVRALAVSGSNLYAGGDFTTVGGSAASNIAKWDGSSWSALGSGLDKPVWALAVSDSNLYAGGDFGIAKWNGSSWSGLGAGINGSVFALAVSGSNLYAGGNFIITTAGGSLANRIAKWNGSSWSALGPGMNDWVWALAVSGSDLYAGGYFTRVGGSASNHIAKWNGSNWSALGSGINGFVYALAVSGSDLYAGGYFTTAGGTAATNVAKWNGSSWSALGSGMNSNVNALAVSGSDLYAGGQFTTAGGKVSAYLARAYLERPTLSILRSGGDVRLSWPTFYESFVLQQKPELANTNGWSNASYPLTTNATIKSATVPSTAAKQFFRLIGN